MSKMRSLMVAAAVTVLSFGTAFAQTAKNELSVYGGYQTAPHSGVTGSDPGGIGNFDFTAGWEGRPFSPPPYYGFRYTRWSTAELGWGIDFVHAKVYADDATLSANALSQLEFSDGLNILTVNAYRRFLGLDWPVVPYVGAGVGVSIPYVHFSSAGGTTTGYQLAGPAVQWVAGATYALNEKWSLFGEYKGTYSVNDIDLNNGGSFSTSIVTNAVNIGVSLGF